MKELLGNEALANRIAMCSINLSGQSFGDDSVLDFIAAEALNHAHEFLQDIVVVQKPYSRDDLVRVVNHAMRGGKRRTLS